jgi:tetratricopeptide (TPR) repeat protein
MARQRSGSRRGKNPPASFRLQAEGPETSAKAAPFRLKPAATVIVVAAVLLLAAVATMLIRTRAAAAQLPDLPNLSNQPPAVRQHLTERDAGARASPRSFDAVGALCLAYHADLFYDEADRCHARAASLAPSDWRWSYYRALLLSERGGGDRLIERLEAIAREQDFGPAWLRLGDAEFKARRYDRAEAAWNRAASVSEPPRTADSPPHRVEAPIAAYAALGLARIALARGETDRARQTLERVLSTSPRFGSAHRLLAECYTALGRPDEARRALGRANRLPPYAPYADPMVDTLARESRNGTFLLRQASEADLSINGEWSEYLTRRALEFDPVNPDVLAKLGRVLRQRGRTEEALDVFARYQKMAPGDFQGLAQLGSTLSDLGRFDEAEPLLRRAIAGLDDALTHYNLGLLLARTGRLDLALTEYERSLDRDPNDVAARTNLAAVLVRQGRLARAEEHLVRVIELDPENAAAHTNYGIVLREQKQIDRAAREFETALRLDPRQADAAEALNAIKH